MTIILRGKHQCSHLTNDKMELRALNDLPKVQAQEGAEWVGTLISKFVITRSL